MNTDFHVLNGRNGFGNELYMDFKNVNSKGGNIAKGN
jgi:hypothetical protein